MGLFRRVSRGIQKAINRAPQSLSRTAAAAGGVISMPLQVAGQGAAQGIQGGLAPALGAATQVLQDNPMLAGLAGSAFGIPGLGGMFGGSSAPSGPYPDTTPEQPGVPGWVWLAAAGAAVLGLVLILRRKS